MATETTKGGFGFLDENRDSTVVAHSSQKELDDNNEDQSFGEKQIGFFGSMSLIVNNITGPAMVHIPRIYQQAGWITPTVMMGIVMMISSFASTMLCKAVALVPNNSNYSERHEIMSLAKLYFNKWGYLFTAILLISSLQAANIASIIISAQTADLALVAVFNYTGGVEFYPRLGWASVYSPPPDAVNPLPPFFDPTSITIVCSLGFLLVMLCSIPLGYLNLDDNIIIQKVTFIALLFISFEWVLNFLYLYPEWHSLPAFGPNQSQVAGTIIFNYAFVVTIPSWLNEKKPSVSVNKSIWYSNILSTVLFISIGILGAVSFSTIPPSKDILNVLNDNPSGGIFFKIISRISVYLFPIVVLMSGIPVFSIIIRYNLVTSGLCRKSIANFWAVLFPWFFSVIFFVGEGLLDVMNWTSLLVNGFINFVIPILLYIFAYRAMLKKKGGLTALLSLDPSQSEALGLSSLDAPAYSSIQSDEKMDGQLNEFQSLDDDKDEEDALQAIPDKSKSKKMKKIESSSNSSDPSSKKEEEEDDDEEEEKQAELEILPKWPCITPRVLIWFSIALTVVTFILVIDGIFYGVKLELEGDDMVSFNTTDLFDENNGKLGSDDSSMFHSFFSGAHRDDFHLLRPRRF